MDAVGREASPGGLVRRTIMDHSFGYRKFVCSMSMLRSAIRGDFNIIQSGNNWVKMYIYIKYYSRDVPATFQGYLLSMGIGSILRILYPQRASRKIMDDKDDSSLSLGSPRDMAHANHRRDSIV